MKKEQGQNAVYDFYTWLNEQQVPEQVCNELCVQADKIDSDATADLFEMHHFGEINEVELCLKLCRIIECAPE